MSAKYLPLHRFALSLLLGSALTPAAVAQPALGEETLEDGEEANNSLITHLISQGIRASAQGGATAHRDAHPKHHGCVRAEFQVAADLPQELRVGAFQPGKQYPAWVRFSNGSGIKADKEPDGRGMAIKLMGVEGDSLSPTAARGKTMDLVQINFPDFFIRNAADYVGFFTKRQEFLATHPKELGIIVEGGKQPVANPLEVAYFSEVPYRFGDATKAIKFRSRPCGAPKPQAVPANAADNYLAQALQATLSQSSACFEFAVQLQKDAVKQPVEDPTVRWEESETPFVKIAELTILKDTNIQASVQYVNDAGETITVARDKFCEDLAFNPWNAAPEHKPLGGINRTRRVVYDTIATLRRDLNGVVPFEPKPDSGFKK